MVLKCSDYSDGTEEESVGVALLVLKSLQQDVLWHLNYFLPHTEETVEALQAV